MKIATFGLDITPAKKKYNCPTLNKLIEKFSPAKVTPYSVEFIGEEFDKCDAVVFNQEKKFDFVFLDLDKIDKRLQRTADEGERALLERLAKILEEEKLLCDQTFSPEENELLKTWQLVTYKPSLGKPEGEDLDTLIKEVLTCAGVILFFTMVKKELRAWDLKKGQTVLAAAGKIHSDLARGFIKAEVVNGSELDKFHNLAEAKARGLAKVVDRDYIVCDQDIIEIRFNV